MTIWALAAVLLINGGAKAPPAEKQLTLEELRAVEMLEILENLDVLLDDSFQEKATAISSVKAREEKK